MALHAATAVPQLAKRATVSMPPQRITAESNLILLMKIKATVKRQRYHGGDSTCPKNKFHK
jgi:hypothetical protein